MASDLRPIEGAPPEGRRLLGVLLQQRRAELGYTHRPAFTRDRLPLTPSGNPNTRLAADIEEAYRDNFPEPRLRQLARAYLVTYESFAAVAHLRARALVPVATDPAAPPAAPDGNWQPPILDRGRRAADAPWAAPIMERLLELRDAGIASPPGSRLFPAGSRWARLWDNPDLDGMDDRDKAWFIADLQRRAAGRNAGSETG